MKVEPFPGELVKQNNYKHVLTQQQIDWLKKYFPEVDNHTLMKKSGMNHSLLHRLARRYGLTKSEKGLKRILKNSARKIKSTCEANGYYDSLRGKAPSEACVEATRRMWQEIREGQRKHPFQVLRKKSPYRWKKFMEQKSNDRKEMIRKEVLRTVYGIGSRTRLKNIVTCKYKRSESSHRYNAKKRGYVLPLDISEQGNERYNIYYTEGTRRGEIFEKNLVKDGFKVLPL